MPAKQPIESFNIKSSPLVSERQQPTELYHRRRSVRIMEKVARRFREHFGEHVHRDPESGKVLFALHPEKRRTAIQAPPPPPPRMSRRKSSIGIVSVKAITPTDSVDLMDIIESYARPDSCASPAADLVRFCSARRGSVAVGTPMSEISIDPFEHVSEEDLSRETKDPNTIHLVKQKVDFEELLRGPDSTIKISLTPRIIQAGQTA
ncbi:uncharacterized protein SPPG_00905 [Spizellomyces punctatus DAOM BR117]|uniref:Uncharacterized protein n=1 Tax=Spizellomyces punctatus (strain DAOM BR117) TaxID=645134 RepID=A0A0L0HRB5_SPIPD|nr:uncharacterized protein SPPG_00905 [Spizellomyces punctatus DAOM BR117]KND03419.1 hypothetical protein SPPG_00905 [Spizellomyces punctatus DAOM BR117]|eukprot:XP_016611458.1 hypothetical protein SPPG_00905 [Spizellomyces punctatus DAOM BR117]